MIKAFVRTGLCFARQNSNACWTKTLDDAHWALFQPEGLKCGIHVLEMNCQRAEPIDFIR